MRIRDVPLGSATYLTAGSLAGLAAGLVVGLVVHSTGNPWLAGLGEAVEPLGTAWINALLMVVIPLVAAYLFVAVAGLGEARRAASLGGLALFCFVALLFLGGAFSAVLSPLILGVIPMEAGAFQARAAETSLEGYTVDPETLGSPLEWLGSLIPSNPFAAAVAGDILPLLVFVVLFALAATRVAPAARELLLGVASAVAEASMVLVRWILVPIPIAVFALAYPMAAATGPAAAAVFLWFVVATCGLLVVFTLLLYPLTWWAGGIRPDRFQKAATPSQMVAVGTRSSLASLPALFVSAERLDLDRDAARLVLPLAVSTFKVNRPVVAPFKLLFLAHVYGVTVSPELLLVFIGTVVLVSFTSPGIPNGGFFVTLPYYVAAGIPVEGLVLLFAVDTIPDVFMTLANVTADLSVAAIVSRFLGRAPAAAPVRVG